MSSLHVGTFLSPSGTKTLRLLTVWTTDHKSLSSGGAVGIGNHETTLLGFVCCLVVVDGVCLPVKVAFILQIKCTLLQGRYAGALHRPSWCERERERGGRERRGERERDLYEERKMQTGGLEQKGSRVRVYFCMHIS